MGDSTCCQTFHDERLMRRTIEYLRRIRFRGIVKVDYKRDGRDGDYKMLEIEPHYQTPHLLGAHAGVNLPAIACRHLHGDSIEVPADYRDNVRLLWFSRDLWTYLSSYRKSKEWTWERYCNSLRGERHYRLFDPEDPMPFFESAVRFAGRRCAAAARGLRGWVTSSGN